MSEIKVVYVDIENVIPYENNPRINDDAVDKVAASIREFGWQQPIVVDKNNVIIVGHTRLKAAQQLGMKQVPVVFTDLSEEKAKAYRLADNKTNEFAQWDFDLLEQELDELNEFELDFDMGDFGFDIEEENEAEQEITEDEVPEPPKEPVCKVWDLWKLGEHRLICGDSTDPAVIDRLMDGVKADMSFTSPPYGVELGYNSYVDTFENTKRLVTDAIPVICAFTNEYVVLNWGDIVSAKDINKTAQPSQFAWLPIYDELMKESGWFIWAERIWKKVHARCSGIWSASSNRPVSDWEYIFTWAHKTPAYNERNSGSHFGVIDSAETAQTDTLSKHPGAFPVYVAGKVIEIHTKHNQSVLDVFGGSGSTLIACEQLNRKCYMCELDERYVSVIVNRWLNFTGRKDEIFCIRDGQELTYDEVFGE